MRGFPQIADLKSKIAEHNGFIIFFEGSGSKLGGIKYT